MKLYGKCKEEFYKWLTNDGYFFGCFQSHTLEHNMGCVISKFNYLSESMKIGVYEDYFDSVGIEFYIKPITTSLLGSTHVINFNDYRYFYEKSKTEARTAAIKKACEIRNEQLNNFK